MMKKPHPSLHWSQMTAAQVTAMFNFIKTYIHQSNVPDENTVNEFRRLTDKPEVIYMNQLSCLICTSPFQSKLWTLPV